MPGRIAIVLGLVAGLATGEAAAAPPGHRLAALTVGPIHANHILVLKSKRRLYLMYGDKVLRVYRVALGRYPKGPKVEEGDARTPEGHYVIDRRLANSNFYKALHISYPNARDRGRARALGVDPGGGIMIHGLPDNWTAAQLGHPGLDWTQGCIAVTDRQMDEIWRMVPVGTPIEIDP